MQWCGVICRVFCRAVQAFRMTAMQQDTCRSLCCSTTPPPTSENHKPSFVALPLSLPLSLSSVRVVLFLLYHTRVASPDGESSVQQVQELKEAQRLPWSCARRKLQGAVVPVPLLTFPIACPELHLKERSRRYHPPARLVNAPVARAPLVSSVGLACLCRLALSNWIVSFILRDEKNSASTFSPSASFQHLVPELISTSSGPQVFTYTNGLSR